MEVNSDAGDGDDWIDRLARAEGEAQLAAFFAARPELRGRTAVERLSREVLRHARIDLGQAERLAAANRWLAAALDDDFCRALSLKDAGHVHYLSGRYREAVESYGSACELFRSQGQEIYAGMALNSSIQALSYLGRYEDAFRAAAEAREIFERKVDPLRLARLDNNEGNVLGRLDRHDEALELHRKALALFRRHGDAQDVAAALLNIGLASVELNDYVRALEAYTELSAHCERHEMPLIGARADYNIAYLCYQRGEYTRAIELYQLTRERGRQSGDAYDLALCDLDQAELYLDLNLTEEGDRLAQLAFSAFEQLEMGYEAAKALAFRAIAANQDGKAFRALALFDEARDRFVREGNLVWSAMIDLYKALILHAEGRSLEARSLAERAREFFLGSHQRSKAALSELLLARIALQMGELAASRSLCVQAIEGFETLDLPASVYKACFVLGQIEEMRGDPAAALDAYLRSHATLESLRSHLRGEELKIAFLKDKLEVYESLVWMTLERDPTAEDRSAVFTWIEQAKSRSLADLIAFRAHSLAASGAVPSRLVDQMRRLREDLNWYYRQIDLHELELTPPAGEEDGAARRRAGGTDRQAVLAKLDDLRHKCRDYEDRLLKTLGEMRTEDTELGSLQAAGAFDLETVRATIPPDAKLLEFYEARDTVYVLLLDRERLEVRAATTASKIRELQRFFQFQLSKFRLGPDYLETFGERIRHATLLHLRELFDELLGPVADRLAADHLIVVPHGPLHYVPFHALYDGERFLIDRFPVSYAPSASVFAMCSEKRSAGHEKSLILGVPDPLTPSIRDEVEAVAESLSGARLFVGEDATEERLRELGPESRLVHVATHGFFRQDNPMFSAIQLGTSRLTLFDLYHLELGCDLVVLSGCGTGLNVVESGDELIGLTRGLLYAGAQSVLATLWDVHDRSTALFMTALYRHLETCANRSEAVRRAMRDLRETYPHPYYWAPFVLIGKPFAG